MTKEEVEYRVHKVGQAAGVGDLEAAHAMEDKLHVAVLQAIADGATNAAELARSALKTANIDFDRHCS